MPRDQRTLLSDAEAALVPGQRVLGSHGRDEGAALAALVSAADLAAQGHRTRAAAAYLLAAEQDPSLVAAWNNLGSLLRYAGQWPLAQKAFGIALDLDPQSGIAHFNLATALAKSGKLTEADEHYLTALKLRPVLWDPKVNPLIVGNPRAAVALHARYLGHPSATPLLDPGPPPLSTGAARD